jgi:hypothetical protein
VLTLTFILSNFIRHERFAEALVKKNPATKLENILTISSETEDFLESIETAINEFGKIFDDFEELTPKEARQIFEVLSCSRKNAALLKRPGSPLPFIIQCSDGHFIRCLSAARSNPMQFLLDSLRHHFPGDYDRHQQSREKTMQKAIRRVLDEGFSGLEYRENIKIKLDGRVLTDIDLVVVEESSGTVLVCQLKHQDLYGSDLHSKYVRSKRLKEEMSRWLDVVNKWVEAVGDVGVRTSFRLPKGFPPFSVCHVAISRHYSHPLKDVMQGGDTAYANWPQFFNAIQLVKEDVAKEKNLRNLVSVLKTIDTNPSQEYLPEPRSEWNFADLKFIVQQEGNAS